VAYDSGGISGGGQNAAFVNTGYPWATITLTSGTVPPGMTLELDPFPVGHAAGPGWMLWGTPTTTGTWTLNFLVTNSHGSITGSYTFATF
jgi:hypothetical protein